MNNEIDLVKIEDLLLFQKRPQIFSNLASSSPTHESSCYQLLLTPLCLGMLLFESP